MEKYTLSKTGKRNIFIVTIVADSNDADYVTTEDIFSKAEFDEYVADALIDLLANYSGRHQLSDYPNEEDLSIPRNGWDGYCHSLKKMTIKHIDVNGEHWDVSLNVPDDEESTEE
ncbi:hypothetical protein M5X00_26230 [Paenibacillus alvei]|uniref:hypothetical protein n=1 Tax=Paenibacillus alvei TaxID=44250 RepID=UPI000289F0BF|nr:hypothetical protein [Paenibacillus alvei]EJW14102.1 hypothetical protein PAV_141p02080 [Paenibacillus alvei DSM 29]MCY9545029.1 hypothetical protein [Paenibacillus alvei]MCY9707749.1 hypothetical protein [Paenibacillus alvei]MCY9757730.1 hypothetical protein [Paenibacillus alvei]MEC0082738.1 hypothetical protein [Paenibacillus alvei]